MFGFLKGQQRNSGTMTDELMTIREMCDAFDVTPRTLRFYEAKELIDPSRRGTKRLYSRRDRGRLKLVLRGKRFGFSLEEIRQLLDLYDTQDHQLVQFRQTYEVGARHLEEMIKQRDELNTAIEELTAQMNWGAELIASLEAEEAKQAES